MLKSKCGKTMRKCQKFIYCDKLWEILTKNIRILYRAPLHFMQSLTLYSTKIFINIIRNCFCFANTTKARANVTRQFLGRNLTTITLNASNIFAHIILCIHADVIVVCTDEKCLYLNSWFVEVAQNVWAPDCYTFVHETFVIRNSDQIWWRNFKHYKHRLHNGRKVR